MKYLMKYLMSVDNKHYFPTSRELEATCWESAAWDPQDRFQSPGIFVDPQLTGHWNS